MNIPAVASLVYAALVVAGGWVGFKKAGSRPSLISGILSGIVLLIAAALSLAGNPSGAKLSMGMASVLAAFFGYRLAKGKKFMPAGLMVLASLVALGIFWASIPR